MTNGHRQQILALLVFRKLENSDLYPETTSSRQIENSISYLIHQRETCRFQYIEPSALLKSLAQPGIGRSKMARTEPQALVVQG